MDAGDDYGAVAVPPDEAAGAGPDAEVLCYAGAANADGDDRVG